MEMETDVADPKQLPKRPDRAQRKMDNKGTRFRSIRMRLKTVCPSPLMQDAINHATVQLSRATTIASKLLQCFVVQQVRDGCLQEITQTTFKRCIDIVGRVPAMLKKEPVLCALAHQHFFQHLPTDYVVPDVEVAGGNGRQYIAAQWLTNARNHIAINFEHRHEQYIVSVVGRWVDSLALPANIDAAERQRITRWAVRTVQCASLVATHTPEAVLKCVREKRSQFQAVDSRGSGSSTTKKKKRKRDDAEEEEEEIVDALSPAVQWLFENEQALADHAYQIRGEIGVEKHQTAFIGTRFTKYLPFFLHVQRRQEWEQEQAALHPPREAHVVAGTRDPEAFYPTRKHHH